MHCTCDWIWCIPWVDGKVDINWSEYKIIHGRILVINIKKDGGCIPVLQSFCVPWIGCISHRTFSQHSRVYWNLVGCRSLILRWAITERDSLLIWHGVLNASQVMLATSIRLQASVVETRQPLLGLLAEAWQGFWKAHLGTVKVLHLALFSNKYNPPFFCLSKKTGKFIPI